MPRAGNGTYTLPSGINPVVTGTLITSNWANTTLSDVAAALTASIAKDGQTVPIANLPMGGFRHTGVGAPTARDQYASLGFVQDASHVRLTSVNVIGSAITGILIGGDNTYAVGQLFELIPNIAVGASPVTLSVNGGPITPVVNPTGTPLAAGDLAAGKPYILMYNGASFVISGGIGEYVLKSGDTMTGDLFINKSVASFFIGQSSSQNGGVANYGAVGVGDVGVFSNFAGGVVRIRPNGRGNATGETIFGVTVADFGSDVFVNRAGAQVAVGVSGTQNGGLGNLGAAGVGDIVVYSETAAGTVRIRPNGKSSGIGGVDFTVSQVNSASDIAVLKSNAFIAMGPSAGNINGGIANYGAVGVGDIGLYSEIAAGTVRIRPNGRTSTVGQVIVTNTQVRVDDQFVTIGSQSGGSTGALRLEAAAPGARMSMTSTGQRRWTIGNDSTSLTIRDESAAADRITINSAGDITLSTGRLGGTGLHNNASGVAGTAIQYIASGTYTPVLTAVANLGASVSAVCQFIRVGNVCTVSGRISLTPTAGANTLTQFRISLPIASIITGATQCGGGGGRQATNDIEAFHIVADAASDEALVSFFASSNAAAFASFTFTYHIA